MAYVISEDCVACGTCIDECPSGAISEGDRYSIDPNSCVDCGTCADVCPSGAKARSRRVILCFNKPTDSTAQVEYGLGAVLFLSRHYKSISFSFSCSFLIRNSAFQTTLSRRAEHTQ